MNDVTDKLAKPIVFFGAPRSGTTIVSEVVLQHFELAWPSNRLNRRPANKRLNYLRRLFDNKHWRLIGKKHSLQGNPFYNELLFKPDESYGMWAYLVGSDVDFGRGFLLGEKASAERREFIRQYFDYLVRAHGKSRLAFKITGPPRMGYLLSLFPDAIFVNIRRAPIPTISSLLKAGFWESRGKTKLWWTGPYSEAEEKWASDNSNNPELMTAFQLKKIYWAERKEISKYAPALLEVSYENFTADPHTEVQRILKFCGLEFDNQIIKYLHSNPVVKRNLPDDSYFNNEVLKDISNLLNGRVEE